MMRELEETHNSNDGEELDSVSRVRVLSITIDPFEQPIEVERERCYEVDNVDRTAYEA